MKIKSIVKHLVVVLTTVATFVFAGCKELPSEQTIETSAKLIGAAAGLAVNQLKVDAVVKNEITGIVTKVSSAVPATNETFAAIWTPVYTAHTEKLLEQKKLSSAQAKILVSSMAIVCDALDYVFDIKYPAAKPYANLVSAATRGFSNGLVSMLKVESETLANTAGPQQYDEDALKVFMTKIK